jgi:hypothetical protein
MLKKIKKQRNRVTPRTLLALEGLCQQLQKSPTIDKNALPAHRNHRFPGLHQVVLETTIMGTVGNLKATTLGTTGNLKTNLGAGEGPTVQVSEDMAALIRTQPAGQRARNQYGNNDMYFYQN